MTALSSFRRLAGAATLFIGVTLVTGCQTGGSICGCEFPGLFGGKLKDPVTGKIKGPFSKLKGPTIPVIPPVVAPAAVPPPQSALGLAPGAPPPGPPTVWDKLGIGAQQQEFNRRQMCQTPAGKVMGAMLNPISKVTFGIIPPFCPITPSLQELLAPGPIGAASKVKMDKLNAEKRKQAVEELKDVDCHYWPEAEEALIAALRTDRNEGVRYTAANVLKEGKCCTNKTIEALSISATGSDRDGAPCETSALVRSTAAAALEHCLKCMCQNPCGRPECEPGIVVPPQEEKPREEPREPDRAVTPASAKPGPAPEPESDEAAQKLQMKAYYDKVRKKPRDVVLAAGRESLAKAPRGEVPIPSGNSDLEVVGIYPPPPPPHSPRPQGLFDPAPAQPTARIDPEGKAETKPVSPTAPVRRKNLLDLITTPSQTQAGPTVPPSRIPLSMPSLPPTVSPPASGDRAPTGSQNSPPNPPTLTGPTREPPLASIPVPMPPKRVPATGSLSPAGEKPAPVEPLSPAKPLSPKIPLNLAEPLSPADTLRPPAP